MSPWCRVVLGNLRMMEVGARRNMNICSQFEYSHQAKVIILFDIMYNLNLWWWFDFEIVLLKGLH
jgi:hypothetical protein